MQKYINVRFPSTTPLSVVSNIASAIGCKLVLADNGGLALIPREQSIVYSSTSRSGTRLEITPGDAVSELLSLAGAIGKFVSLSKDEQHDVAWVVSRIGERPCDMSASELALLIDPSSSIGKKP